MTGFSLTVLERGPEVHIERISVLHNRQHRTLPYDDRRSVDPLFHQLSDLFCGASDSQTFPDLYKKMNTEWIVSCAV